MSAVVVTDHRRQAGRPGNRIQILRHALQLGEILRAGRCQDRVQPKTYREDSPDSRWIARSCCRRRGSGDSSASLITRAANVLPRAGLGTPRRTAPARAAPELRPPDDCSARNRTRGYSPGGNHVDTAYGAIVHGSRQAVCSQQGDRPRSRTTRETRLQARSPSWFRDETGCRRSSFRVAREFHPGCACRPSTDRLAPEQSGADAGSIPRSLCDRPRAACPGRECGESKPETGFNAAQIVATPADIRTGIDGRAQKWKLVAPDLIGKIDGFLRTIGAGVGKRRVRSEAGRRSPGAGGNAVRITLTSSWRARNKILKSLKSLCAE